MPRPRLAPLSCAVALSALTFAPALAQDAGFAVELSPPRDYFSRLQLGVRAYGPAVEPAAGFVRGCRGHAVAEGAGARFEVTERFDRLVFTALGEGIGGLVLATPDGLYRCALARADGLVVADVAGAEPGPYAVWLTGAEGAALSGRIFASTEALSRIDIEGLDIAGLGEPRAGRHVFTGGTPRQMLAGGAQVIGQDSFAPLNRDYCPGYGRLDAPDAVLTLDGFQNRLSILALSGTDLTLAVHTPAGEVLCNDDSFGLNPAVTVEGATAGDYHIFVGSFSQGARGSFDLFANSGGPAFSDAVYDDTAEPRVARARFDRDLAGARGQRLAMGPLVANDAMDQLPAAGYCAGYTGLDAPDVVMTLDAPESMISLYATSDVDLTIAVRAPDGHWECNDDSFGLNPAVSFFDAPAGDYHIYVGAFSQGRRGNWSLMAAMGEPVWDGAPSHGALAASLNAAAAPAVAALVYGPQTRVDPRVIFDIVPSTTEAWPLGEGCAGYVDASRPDIVVTAEFGLPQLMVYMVSEADGVLAVVGPDGHIHCNDDFEGLNPGVMIPNPQPGDYAVFAGTYGGTGGLATLGVTIASPLWVMDREH